MQSVLIIGGGAAGLMCAYQLSRHKLNITLLEAKHRLGGRIRTVTDKNFSQSIETGAEFIHGDLPNTLALLKEANIRFHPIGDEMFQLQEGHFSKKNNFSSHWNKLMKQMASLSKTWCWMNF